LLRRESELKRNEEDQWMCSPELSNDEDDDEYSNEQPQLGDQPHMTEQS
jgi:hypothetical protein